MPVQGFPVSAFVIERTEVKLDHERADRKSLHWHGVLAAACEQSGRARLPVLAEPASLVNYAAAETADLKLALDPGADLALGDLPISRTSTLPGIALVIGPEGGLSNRDLAALEAGGFRGLRIGPRTLRTETAGLAAIAALQAMYGDW